MVCCMLFIRTYIGWKMATSKPSVRPYTIHGSYGIVSFQFLGFLETPVWPSSQYGIPCFKVYGIPCFKVFVRFLWRYPHTPQSYKLISWALKKKKLCITARHKKKRNGGMFMFFKGPLLNLTICDFRKWYRLYKLIFFGSYLQIFLQPGKLTLIFGAWVDNNETPKKNNDLWEQWSH